MVDSLLHVATDYIVRKKWVTACYDYACTGESRENCTCCAGGFALSVPPVLQGGVPLVPVPAALDLVLRGVASV